MIYASLTQLGDCEFFYHRGTEVTKFHKILRMANRSLGATLCTLWLSGKVHLELRDLSGLINAFS